MARYTLLSSLLLLLAIARLAVAFPGGAPVCSVTLATPGLASMTNNANLRQSGTHGWSLSVSGTTYTPGSTLSVSVVNTDTNLRFRGLLLWTQSQASQAFVGSFSFSSTLFQAASDTPCSGTTASITHKSAANKAQSDAVFSWSPPNSNDAITLQAFLVEDCGFTTPNCNGVYYLLSSVTLTRSTNDPGTTTGSGSGSGSGSGTDSGTGSNSATGSGSATGTGSGGNQQDGKSSASITQLSVALLLAPALMALIYYLA